MQETQQIVEVRTYEFGSGGGAGAGGPGGGAPGGGAPRGPSFGRILLRVVAVLVFAAIAIPALVLGLSCLVAAVAVGLAVWLVRALLRAVRGGPRGGQAAGVTHAPPAGGDDLRENVRVRTPRE